MKLKIELRTYMRGNFNILLCTLCTNPEQSRMKPKLNHYPVHYLAGNTALYIPTGSETTILQDSVTRFWH